jgi:hypothetical protein
MMRVIGRTRAASAASPKEAATPPLSTQTKLAGANRCRHRFDERSDERAHAGGH